jgi:hypothetical protein
VKLWARRNYPWRPYCQQEIGLTRDMAMQIFEMTNNTIDWAYSLIVLTLFQILICGIIMNLLIGVPFFKAYPPKGFEKNDLYRNEFFHQIREGKHFYYLLIRNTISTIFVIIQLMAVFIMEHKMAANLEILQRMVI